MKKRNRKRGREGFTLTEVIVSIALLMATVTGFLMVAGANTGLPAKEHRLDQSNYRLSAMAEKGLGEAIDAELVVEFSVEGDSGYPDAGVEEIFYQYNVREDESRDEEFGDCSGPGYSTVIYRHRQRMDNRSSKGNMTGSRGFTLLETIIALVITVMVTVLAIGFIRPQIGLYNEFDQLSQVKAMCAEAHAKLEKVLRYGYVYHVDPDRPDELAYYIRKTEPYESAHGFDGSVYEMLPPMDKWPRIAVGDSEVEEMDGMTLELGFGGTTSREVRALLVVKEEEEQVYEQKVVTRSAYGHEIEGDDVVGW